MMKMSVQKAAKALDLPVDNIHHCALSEGVSSARQFDIVFAPLNFVNMYKDAQAAGVIVIGLRNVLSEKEVKEKLVESGAFEKFKR
ncbi:MAG: PTS ascorbate transporter subunit IIB [Oscillospiraceae bacterium]|jgi:PTS system ascorbate-specific IIB component|nr:PTS ascorbate transporter subunit IIB [Oscillospiraceae bacterium]